MPGAENSRLQASCEAKPWALGPVEEGRGAFTETAASEDTVRDTIMLLDRLTAGPSALCRTGAIVPTGIRTSPGVSRRTSVPKGSLPTALSTFYTQPGTLQQTTDGDAEDAA